MLTRDVALDAVVDARPDARTPARDAAFDAADEDAERVDNTLDATLEDSPRLGLDALAEASAADVSTDRGPVSASCIAPAPVFAPVCAGRCGNNVIDQCQRCQGCAPECEGSMTMFCQTVREQCDGDATPTCAMLGYRGGVVRCASNCSLDVTGCEWCTTDPHVVRCAAVGGEQFVDREFGMASAGERVGLAYINRGSDYRRSLHVAVYDRELALVARSTCLDLPALNSASIVATPDGWLVVYAAGRPSVVYSQRFDGNAQAVGEPTTIGEGSYVQLTQGPAGQALLLYSFGDFSVGPVALRAAIVGDAGTLLAPSVQMLESEDYQHPRTAFWLGDDFYVSTLDGNRHLGVWVFRVRIEHGTVTIGRQAHRVTNAMSPLLFSSGGHPWLAYLMAAGSFAQHLDPNLFPAADPVLLDPALTASSTLQAVLPLTSGLFAIGQNRVGAGSLDATRVDTRLRPVGALVSVSHAGRGAYSGRVLAAPLGGRVLVAWSGEVVPQAEARSALQLALVDP